METRGAGIVVQGELIDLLRTHGADALPTTHCTVRRYLNPEGGDGEEQRAPQDFTSWEAIYRTLAAAFPTDRYHRGATLTDFGDSEGSVQAHIDGHGLVEADLLVAADGAQSPTRRRFLPDLSSTYAGYVAWRGMLDEADAPPDLVRFFDDAFTFCEARSAVRSRPARSASDAGGPGGRNAPTVSADDRRRRPDAHGVWPRVPSRRRGVRRPAAHGRRHRQGGA